MTGLAPTTQSLALVLRRFVGVFVLISYDFHGQVSGVLSLRETGVVGDSVVERAEDAWRSDWMGG